MNIWIDTVTGTWGSAKDIVFVDIDPSDLDYMNTSEIIEVGNEQGMPLM